MKRIIVLCLLVAGAAFAASSAAASNNGPWYSYVNSGGHCDAGQASGDGTTYTSNVSQADANKKCHDATDPPPTAVTGWPSGSGTASGTFTCSPITLTSTDDANGYGAIDFDGPFGTFASLPIFSASDYTILSGTGAQSEPYLIVRFSDSTQAFVYATDVSGPGTRYSDLVGNSYLTRAQALALYGTKQVASVTLAVDNGDLSIEVVGVTLDNCASGGTIPLVNHMFLCYSKFQQDSGQVFTNAEALSILADPAIAGWVDAWAPYAVLGTDTSDHYANISGYHLVCNPPASLKTTGQWLYADNDGAAEFAPFDALVAGSAGYPVVK